MSTSYAKSQSFEVNQEQLKLQERNAITLPLEEKIYIFDQLATELDSGTPLSTAFQSRVKDFDNLQVKHTDRRAFIVSGKPRGEQFFREMNILLGDLGKPFNEAARQFPGVFDPQFLALIEAAQRTGQYGPILRRQSQFLTEQKQLQDHIKSVMRYPVLVLLVAIAVMVLAFAVIMPGFLQIYEGLQVDQQFHWTTELIISITRFFKDFWPVFLLLIICGCVAYLWLRKNLPTVREMEDRILLRIPKVNRYFVLVNLLSFFYSFILLREAGETLTKSFVLAVEAMGNSELRDAGREAARNFEMGVPQFMYLALAQTHPIFSEASSVYAQLKSYEEYAQLDQLERYTKILKHNADQIRDELSSYVQPVLLLLLGGLVGFLVFSLYIPMFEVIAKLSK